MHAAAFERDDDRAVGVGAQHAGPRTLQLGDDPLRRVPVRVVRPDGDDGGVGADRGEEPVGVRVGAVVGRLEHVDGDEPTGAGEQTPLRGGLSVTSEQQRPVGAVHTQDEAVLVQVVAAQPSTRWTEDAHPRLPQVERVPGSRRDDRHVGPPRGVVDRRRHVACRRLGGCRDEQRPHRDPVEHRRQPGDVVEVPVGEHRDVEFADT